MLNAVEMRQITKQFPGVLANDQVDLTVPQGTIHAIIGENGAGKSTLMKLLYGLQRPDAGEIYLHNRAVTIHNPRAAMQLGVGMVHQHFMLVPSFTVAENIVLGIEPLRGLTLDRPQAINATRTLSCQYGLTVDPTVKVEDTPVGIQQRVEILKTLYRGANIIIFDEPTAVLTPQEVQELFTTLRTLARSGKTILFITHKLQEVLEVADDITVMRRGRVVGKLPAREATETILARLMVGREVVFQVAKREFARGAGLLEVQHVSALDKRGLLAVNNVSLQVAQGEIVGIAGIEGNGQTELIEALTGLRPVLQGQIRLRGQALEQASVLARRRCGMAHIPEDRMTTGLNLKGTVAENLIAGKHAERPYQGFGWRALTHQIEAYARRLMQQFDIRAAETDTTAATLSGGNLQKIVVAREFSFGAPCLVISQPTRGIDVGAIESIHQMILDQCAAGAGVLLVSAELDELYKLSDRLLVMYVGEIVGEFAPREISKEELGLYMTGAKRQA